MKTCIKVEESVGSQIDDEVIRLNIMKTIYTIKNDLELNFDAEDIIVCEKKNEGFAEVYVFAEKVIVHFISYNIKVVDIIYDCIPYNISNINVNKKSDSEISLRICCSGNKCIELSSNIDRILTDKILYVYKKRIIPNLK